MEMIKLLVAARATPTLAVMAEVGLLLRVLGGVPYLAGFENVAKVEAAAGLAPDAARRLGGARGHDRGRCRAAVAAAAAHQQRARAAGRDGRELAASCRPPWASGGARGALPAEAGAFCRCALLAWARSQGAHDAAWRDFVTLPQRWTAPVFPLKAADFMARGVARGPALGAALRAAEAAWIVAGFPQDAEALDKIVSRLCA